MLNIEVFAKLEYQERPHTVGRPRFADVHNKQLGKSISRFCSSETEAVDILPQTMKFETVYAQLCTLFLRLSCIQEKPMVMAWYNNYSLLTFFPLWPIMYPNGIVYPSMNYSWGYGVVSTRKTISSQRLGVLFKRSVTNTNVSTWLADHKRIEVVIK